MSPRDARTAILGLITPGHPQAIATPDEDLYDSLARQTRFSRDEVVAACEELHAHRKVSLVTRDGLLRGICRTEKAGPAAVDAGWVIDTVWPVREAHRPSARRTIPDTGRVADGRGPHTVEQLNLAVSRLNSALLAACGAYVHPLAPLLDGDWTDKPGAERILAALCSLDIVRLVGTCRSPRYQIRPRRIKSADIRTIAAEKPTYLSFKILPGQRKRKRGFT